MPKKKFQSVSIPRAETDDDTFSINQFKRNKFHWNDAPKTKKSKQITRTKINALLMNNSHYDKVVLALKEKRLECNRPKKE